MKGMLKYLLMIIIPAAFGMSVLGRQVLTVLATADFAIGWFLIPIIASSMVIFQTLTSADYILMLVNKTGIILRFTMIAAVENLVLNFLLVPSLGILGAAISTFIAYLTYGIIIWNMASRYLKIELDYVFIGKSVFASLLMSLGVYFINFNGAFGLLVAIIAGVLIYFIVLISLKGINVREVNSLIRSS